MQDGDALQKTLIPSNVQTSGRIFPWQQKDLSAATKNLCMATERSPCGHGEICLRPQRDLSLDTKKPFCGNRDVSLWPQGDLSVATTDLTVAMERPLWPQC